jgi:hypothetical protein
MNTATFHYVQVRKRTKKTCTINWSKSPRLSSKVKLLHRYNGTFPSVQGLIANYHELMVTDKDSLSLWSKRAHAALRAYQVRYILFPNERNTTLLSLYTTLPA